MTNKAIRNVLNKPDCFIYIYFKKKKIQYYLSL
jgi:hypothetical protein